jgi:hypothetical protein
VVVVVVVSGRKVVALVSCGPVSILDANAAGTCKNTGRVRRVSRCSCKRRDAGSVDGYQPPPVYEVGDSEKPGCGSLADCGGEAEGWRQRVVGMCL